MKQSASVNLKEGDLMPNQTIEIGPIEKGFCVPVHFDNKKAHEQIVDFLIFHARLNLEPGQIFEIRGKCEPREGGNLGKVRESRDEVAADWGLAWYWGCEEYRLKQEPLFRVPVSQAKHDEDIACILIARIKA